MNPPEEQLGSVPLKQAQGRGVKEEVLLNKGGIYHDKISLTVNFLGATSHR